MKGFWRNSDGSRGDGPFRSTLFVVSSDEDQWQSNPFQTETALDFQSVHAGHLHVDHSANEPLRRFDSAEETLTRSKSFGAHTE